MSRRSTRRPLTSAIQVSGLDSTSAGSIQLGFRRLTPSALRITAALALAVLSPMPLAFASWASVMCGLLAGSERKLTLPSSCRMPPAQVRGWPETKGARALAAQGSRHLAREAGVLLVEVLGADRVRQGHDGLVGRPHRLQDRAPRVGLGHPGRQIANEVPQPHCELAFGFVMRK